MRLSGPTLALLILGSALFASAQTAPTPSPRRPAPTQPLTASGAIPMPPDRAVDSYAIYSLLMPGPSFASMSPEQNGTWAIAGVTVSVDDRNPAVPPQGQLKPPPGDERGFQEALGDYESNQHVRVQLSRRPFRLSRAFTLLTPGDVQDFRAAKSATPSAETRSRWAGYPGITFFSEVYFDASHHSALVFVGNWCAHICGAGTWVFLEKQNGQWVRQSGVSRPGA